MKKKRKKRYRLFNDDCFEVFRKIPDKRIDMVLVDPPYGTTACKWDSVIPLEPMWKELKRVIKERAAIVITTGQPFTTVLISSNLSMFKYCWVWDKHIPRLFQVAKYRPMSRHEDVAVFGKGRVVYNPQMIRRGNPVKYRNARETETVSGIKADPKDRVRISTHIHPDTIIEGKWMANRGKLHPTQKPVALMEYLIKTYTNKGAIVLDFAMGSGTTGVACGNLGRRFIGCDNDTEHGYFEIAEKRIRQAYKRARSSFGLQG